MITDALLYSTIRQSYFHSFDRFLSRFMPAFNQCEKLSACIILYSAHPLTFEIMPVNVHRCKAVLSLVSFPFFLSNVSIFLGFCEPKPNKDFMNPVVPYVLLVISINHSFQSVRRHAEFLLFHSISVLFDKPF